MYVAVLFQRICVILILIPVTCTHNDTEYVLPTATVQALKPRGFRISIPGDPRIKLFHVEANFYDSNNNYYGGVREFVVKETNGRWMYENRESPLKVGDVVRYYIFVSLRKGEVDIHHKHYEVTGYRSDGINYKITAVDDPDDPIPPNDDCKPTVTRVLGKNVCAGQVLLEDNFETLREDLWQIDQYVPVDHPEHPFITYQKVPSDPTVLIKNGQLNIHPKLQLVLLGSTNVSLYSGKLDLHNGCTGEVCDFSASAGNILPPIVSGRISSRIAFTYGVLEMRVKMPIGDWLYPELLLEPYSKKYGTRNYASGILKIATVFGNKYLNNTEYTNKFLKSFALTNGVCKSVLESTKEIVNGTWSDDFHVFTVKWTPDIIELFLDGEKWGNYRPGARGLRSWMPRYCRDTWFELLEGAGTMAPFDSYFFLSLSVAAGGVEFPDELSLKDGSPKPWKNYQQRASINFWNDRQHWLPTWTQPLIVDYVKITAL